VKENEPEYIFLMIQTKRYKPGYTFMDKNETIKNEIIFFRLKRNDLKRNTYFSIKRNEKERDKILLRKMK
jgi:hypothetical protein